MAISWQDAEKTFSRYLLTTKRSPRTALSYCYNTRLFWHDLTAAELDPILASREDVEAWLAHRLKRVSSNKAHVDLCAIRAFYECLKVRGLRDDNPAEGMQIKRSESAPEPPFTAREIRRLLRACSCPRDQLIILLLATTGLRIAEAIDNLRYEDIDFEQGTIRVHAKGDRHRLIAPPPDIMNALKEHSHGVLSGPVWFTKYGTPMTAKAWRADLAVIAWRSGVRNVHPHRFRAHFAIRMLRASGGDLQAVQELLGHRSINSTQIYTRFDRVNRSLQLMRAAGDRLLSDEDEDAV